MQPVVLPMISASCRAPGHGRGRRAAAVAAVAVAGCRACWLPRRRWPCRRVRGAGGGTRPARHAAVHGRHGRVLRHRRRAGRRHDVRRRRLRRRHPRGPAAAADRRRRGRPGGRLLAGRLRRRHLHVRQRAVLGLRRRHPLNKPIVGMAATPDGGGYWLVASDGGIFTYGDAGFFGSTGSHRTQQADRRHGGDRRRQRLLARGLRRRHLLLRRRAVLGLDGSIALNKPIVGHGSAHADGNGYWLVASDGGIFTYGDAPFLGSTGSIAPEPADRRHGAHARRRRLLAGGARRRGLHLRRRRLLGQRAVPAAPAALPAALLRPRSRPVVSIINDAPGPQATHQNGLRVAFAGDSLSLYEGHYVQADLPALRRRRRRRGRAAASPTARRASPGATRARPS